MNLYRIDTSQGPVSDFLGPCLIRSFADARERGIAAARANGGATVTRISGRTAALSVALRIDGNGRVTREGKRR